MVLPSSEGTGGVPGAAPADGNYTLGGQQYQVRKGDPLPAGAVFVAEEADEQEASAPARTGKGAAAKKGGTETTKAAGPAETAG